MPASVYTILPARRPEYGYCHAFPRPEPESAILPNAAAARPLALAGYPIALLLILTSVMDTLPKILPADFGSRDWRFGALGLVFNSTVTPVLGLVIAAAAAIVAGQWKALRAISVVFLLVAVLAVVGGLVFLVDYSGIIGGVDERAAGSFRVATWKTALIVLMLLPAAIWLGIGGLRAAREAPVPLQDHDANLVVGR